MSIRPIEETDDMTTFLMETDGRARKVAKELAAICKEHGVRLPLTKSQAATARLYGHPTWNDLLASIGQGRSQDDHELAADELAERRKLQISALESAGVPAELAPEVLSRLAPTGRSEASIENSSTVTLLEWAGIHHPARVMSTIDAAGEVFSGWDGRIAELSEMYLEWIGERSPYRLDRLLATEQESVDAVYDLADQVHDGQGFVIDATAVAESFSRIDVRDQTWTPEVGHGTFYIHFGVNRFASPFPGLGVEGCYVEIDKLRGGTSPDHVGLTFVVSEEIAPQEGFHGNDYDMFMRIRNLLRRVDVSFSPVEGDTLAACFGTTSYSEYPDEVMEAWAPYLAPLVNAAWNSIVAYGARKVPVFDAVDEIVPAEGIRRIERARTEPKRREAIMWAAANTGELAIRYLDRRPARDDKDAEYSNSPRPLPNCGSQDYIEDYVQSLLDDALDTMNPVGMGWLARRARQELAHASGLVDFGGDALDAVEHPAARQFLRSKALLMNSYWYSGRHQDAAAIARELVACQETDRYGYLPAIVKVLLETGDVPGAQAAVSKLAPSLPKDGITAWTVALVNAASGDRDAAVRSLLPAFFTNPMAAAEILKGSQGSWVWFLHEGDPIGSEDEADEIAYLHSGTWSKIEGWQGIILEGSKLHSDELEGVAANRFAH